jgi:hypothetical protein
MCMPSLNQSDTTPKTCKEYQDVVFKYICILEELWQTDETRVTCDDVDDLRHMLKNYTDEISPLTRKIIQSR